MNIQQRILNMESIAVTLSDLQVCILNFLSLHFENSVPPL